ncbi:uncharacterized protein PG998_009027 [Apiospora kogelbergensis]|uniref:uncharacterized protein n=1 Tax=Apiospora kogelbergensis TaxID=1337665 RepID=UPI00312CC91A
MSGNKSSLRPLTQEERAANPLYLLVPAAKYDQEGGDEHQASACNHVYDWIRNIKVANDRIVSAGMAVLPMDKVGRVVEGGRTTSVYNMDKHGTKYFVSYSGRDVFARVPELFMKDTHVYQLAALYVSMMNNCSHPDKIDLETSWHGMKDGSWAIHIHPKPGYSANKTRS